MSAKPQKPQPPRWADKLLERFCSPHLLEQVMGDLHERFFLIVAREGEAKAKWKYWREVLAYMRPSIMKRKSSIDRSTFSHISRNTSSDPTAMLANYFKIAYRNLVAKKAYSAINILGLSIGMACSFFILLWVTDEISYDRFHTDGSRIHQAWRHMNTGGQIYTMNSLPKGIADQMKAEYPEVEDVVTTHLNEKFVVTIGDKNYREIGAHASPTFFRMFSFPLILGNPQTALQDMTSAVITERTARKLFGDDWTNALGRSFTLDHKKDLVITGVVADIPNNSSIQFDVLVPVQELLSRDERYEEWYFMAFNIFAKLEQGTSLPGFNEKISNLFNRHAGATDHQIFLQPFEDVYLNSFYKGGQLTGGRIDYVHIFTAIAIFLLLIASINFMNLATARSSQRAREIGVRKVIGAHQQSLIAQFVVESVATAFIAFLFAVALVVTLLPAFNYLTGKHFTPGNLDRSFLLGILGIALIVGVVSGSYPALYLSSFKPVAVLRGTFRQRSGAVISLRKGLVVFQFALSVVLIVSTIAVYLQLNHIRTENLGMDRENLLYVTREGALLEKHDAIAQELMMQPGIASVTASGQNPLNIGNNTTSVEWSGKDDDNHQLFYIINASNDFAKTMRMELLAGRDFSKAFASDSISYLVNEETARLIGGDVVGKTLNVYGDRGPIVGVIRNFSMNSLYMPIEPAVVRFHPEWAGHLFIRTEPGRTEEALAGLEAVYKKFNPGYPLAYTFVDQEFEQTYHSEAVMGTLANIFAVVALVISCLGLFGLTSFTVEQRTKELGVRKVLGASAAGIVIMLSTDFLKLVLIGCLIAIPITWYITNQWLENFADRINLGVGVFLASGLVATLIALATISFQSIKAAISNPVDCLRNE